MHKMFAVVAIGIVAMAGCAKGSGLAHKFAVGDCITGSYDTPEIFTRDEDWEDGRPIIYVPQTYIILAMGREHYRAAHFMDNDQEYFIDDRSIDYAYDNINKKVDCPRALVERARRFLPKNQISGRVPAQN